MLGCLQARLIMFAMLLGAGAGPVAAQLRGQNPDQIAPPPAATPLPSDAELEAAGARIGGIEIDTVQIFDLDDPADNNWLFRAADHLHKRTRVSAIARAAAVSARRPVFAPAAG